VRVVPWEEHIFDDIFYALFLELQSLCSYDRRVDKLHSIDVYKKIIGVESSSTKPKIYLSNEEKSFVETFWKNNFADSAEVIVIQAGSAIASKMWRKDNFIKLSNKLLESGYTLLFTGSAEEKPLVDEITCNLTKQVCSVVGELSFRETLALTTKAKKIRRRILFSIVAVLHSKAIKRPTNYFGFSGCKFGKTN